MAVYEIVLVANRNGHRHVVVGWGHSLLKKTGEKRKRHTQTRELDQVT